MSTIIKAQASFDFIFTAFCIHKSPNNTLDPTVVWPWTKSKSS